MSHCGRCVNNKSSVTQDCEEAYVNKNNVTSQLQCPLNSEWTEQDLGENIQTHVHITKILLVASCIAH